MIPNKVVHDVLYVVNAIRREIKHVVVLKYDLT